MDIAELEKIGLKEKEAKVYLALLKEGTSLANNLAKKVAILRSSIYDYLDVLLDKGFISYTIRSGKKYFQAVNPEKILENFKERKEQEESSLKTLVPQLAMLKNIEQKKVNVEVYEGREGIKSAFMAILRARPSEMLSHGSSGVSYKLLPFFMEHWHKQRIKQKMPLRVIYNDDVQARDRIKYGPPLKLAEYKFIGRNELSYAGTIIYNDNVLIAIFDPETPLAILIESKSITRLYKQEFEILWKKAKKS
jgi:sugar-specific transcriptional regulator TrmB